MFLMSYFRTPAEALHLALSSDGIRWRAVNDNQPVFESSIGTKTLRDPFIFRDENGLFHLLSTNGWNSATIYHAVSDNLTEWRDESLIPVMESVPRTRNCWAPEAFYEAESSLYHIIWSSTTPLSGDEKDGHGYNHRIWSVSTPDFVQFSAPSIFFDPGYGCIDACVAPRKNGGYLMAFKDERGENKPDSPHKAIRVATAPQASGPWTIRETFVSPTLTEGPALFHDGKEWLMLFDHFMQDFFGAVASSDGENWRDISGQILMPPHPRHASVIKIDDATAQKLEAHWAAN